MRRPQSLHGTGVFGLRIATAVGGGTEYSRPAAGLYARTHHSGDIKKVPEYSLVEGKTGSGSGSLFICLGHAHGAAASGW
jgi:hypothetical protein